MRLYKLTDENGIGLNNTQWAPGATKILPKVYPPRLCSPDLFHASKYKNSVLALNYIHNNFSNPCLWDFEGNPAIESWDQVGCFQLTAVRQIPIPEWYKTPESRDKVYSRFFSRIAALAKPKFVMLNPSMVFLDALNIIDNYFSSGNPGLRPDANTAFRTLLHATYKLYMDDLPKETRELGFILYLDAFCRLDPTYLRIHIGSMYESACAVNLLPHLILDNIIEGEPKMLLVPEKREFPKTYIERALEMFRKRNLNSIVEIGCARMPLNHPIDQLNIDCCMDGHSSIFWARETDNFITIDINPTNMDNAKLECLKATGKKITGFAMDGIEFLQKHNQKIDLLFLDAWDMDMPESAQRHLEAFQAAEDKLHDQSLILIDDTDCILKDNHLHFSGDGISGKGRLVIPYAVSKGWKVIFYGRQTLLSK